MNEVNRVVIHRSYTEEIIYDMLKNDPMSLLQFFAIVAIWLFILVVLYDQFRKSIIYIIKKLVIPKNESVQQTRYSYKREIDKYIVVINIVSFILSVTISTTAVRLLLYLV